MRVAIGVFAEPPLPRRCVTKLLTAHTPEWAAGLYAAMLRDTLDGLQSIDASEYLVFGPSDEESTSALERHVPAPWSIVTDIANASHALLRLGALEGLVLLARSDAPSAPIDPVSEAIAAANSAEPFAMLGPSEQGDAWIVGASQVDAALVEELPWASPELAATMRVRCTKASVPLHELPAAALIEEPSALLALLEELRRHPERAPRTAHYVVTHA